MDFYLLSAYILSYIGLFTASFYIISNLSHKKKNLVEESEDKTVSIIIPAYNEEKSIERTIESALNIDYPKEKLELIVIDDGSKDNTYKLAKKFTEISTKFKIRVYTKENGGKGSALNFGIKKSKNELIFSMDADTFVDSKAVRIMVSHFYSDDVMAVTPSMGVYKPKGILQRVQQIEYYLGVFLRKSFAITNSIHVTPGAFSAYRKKFFEKYGGYDEDNITEDLEIALRIQSHDLLLENSPKAVVYTIAPRKFKDLLFQRRRWYTGLIRNLWKYRCLFGPKKGVMGTIVLPLAVITIFSTIIMTTYILTRTMLELKKEILMLNSINFKFLDIFEFSSYYSKLLIERLFFDLLSYPIFILLVLFISLFIFYMLFAKKQMLYKEGIKFSLFLFLIFYSFLFTFWWIISFSYTIFCKKVEWGNKK
jgi:cellulose synthase/poly-beta-1,6-N-acetylglucosamine synthase-like glycosyltransferase